MKTYDQRMEAILKKATTRKVVRTCLKTLTSMLCIVAVIFGLMQIPIGVSDGRVSFNGPSGIPGTTDPYALTPTMTNAGGINCDTNENTLGSSKTVRIWDIMDSCDGEIQPAFSVDVPELNDARIEYDMSESKIYVDGEYLLGGPGYGCVAFYLSDLTGDGCPELCFVMALGSGIVDVNIVIIDYATKDIVFSLSDRGYHDYYLFIRDGVLCVKETEFMKQNAVRTGVLAYNGMVISVVWDNEVSGTKAKDISDYLVEEDGQQYLILPVSKERVKIWDEQTQYLDDIDLDLLKAAEERISREISQYSQNSGFYLQIEEGVLFLYAEVIVDITPPSGTDGGGCGVDHEHRFFKERITK